MSEHEADTTGDALAAAVGLGMAEWRTPTAGSYLAQVPKARIVEVVTEAVSVKKATPLAKLKKGKAVAATEAWALCAGAGEGRSRRDVSRLVALSLHSGCPGARHPFGAGLNPARRAQRVALGFWRALRLLKKWAAVRR